MTLGVGEPFTQTLTVAFYFALLFALPLILYQAYAFVLPAFSPRERRVALPLMAMVPFLFIAGVVFAYFLVLPAAIGFLQNFNSDEFDVLVQAKSLYSFAILTLIIMGVLFQMPVGMLALTRLGVVTPAPAAPQLALRHRDHRRDRGAPARAPTRSPRCIEMVPMLVLYGAEYPAGDVGRALRPPHRGARGAGARRDRLIPRCSSTSEAAAAAAPSRSSTSTLAILMGGGLVFFGIGGGTLGGGLFDAFKGGGGGGSDTFSKQVSQAQKTLKANPNDAAAWAIIARARFQQAGPGRQLRPADQPVHRQGQGPAAAVRDGLGALPRAEPEQARRRAGLADGAGVLAERAQPAREGGEGGADRDGGATERADVLHPRGLRLRGRRQAHGRPRRGARRCR